MNNCITNIKNDTRKTWKTTNDIFQRSKKRSLPIYFREGDCKITQTVETANKFNVFFTNIGQHLANKIKHTSNTNESFYMTGNSELFFFQFQEINEESLIKIIDKFPAKTSSVHDVITLKQLKYLKLIIIKPVTLLLNQIFNTGIFPDRMKIAKVIPIFKNDDETLFCNYRPISLLPVISKVVEKVMHDQIYSFFYRTFTFQ